MYIGPKERIGSLDVKPFVPKPIPLRAMRLEASLARGNDSVLVLLLDSEPGLVDRLMDIPRDKHRPLYCKLVVDDKEYWLRNYQMTSITVEVKVRMYFEIYTPEFRKVLAKVKKGEYDPLDLLDPFR